MNVDIGTEAAQFPEKDQWDFPCSVLCNLARYISPLQTIM
jgi:hypothetical protein